MSNYWRKRFELLEQKSNAYGLEAFRQIEPAFINAEKEIQKEIEAWYGRYAKNNNVSMLEARRQLSTKELKEFRWDVDEYIKYGRENAIDPKWMKELENASARVHINRLEALKIRTQQAAEAAFGNELDVIDEMARKVYTEDYYHSIFEMHKGFGVGWEIGQIDERKLGQLISKPWASDGKNFSQRIWNHRDQLVNELHTQMTQACVLGKHPKGLIDSISKKFKTTKGQAGRLVMTEQAFFHSAAQKDAFKELDVEEFEIVATLDSSTSETCQDMDGQHFPMSEYEVGVTAPPFHCWCRSVTAPYFEDNYGGERAARDVDGKTYYVPDTMKYKDWKEHFVDKTKNPDDWLKPVHQSVSLAEKIQLVKDAIAANNGVITEAHIKEAGKAVQDELVAEKMKLKAEWEQLQAEYDSHELKKKCDEMMRERGLAPGEAWKMGGQDFWNIYEGAELTTIRNRMNAAKQAYIGTWETNAADLKNKLAEFRKMGVGSYDLKKVHYGNRGTLRDLVTEAYNHYPSDWVEASIKKGKLKITKVDRGFYNGSEIAISGWHKSSQIETAFHELGHRFEDTVKGIYDAEHEFYLRRTAGCPLEWLGGRYAKHEKSRKDNFLDPYMGKEYKDKYHELVSMGFQMAYTEPIRLWEDEDFAQFIYGILSLY